MFQIIARDNIAFLSDPHLVWETPVGRKDDIVTTETEKLSFVLDWCDKNNADLCISGDLFDAPRGWRILDLSIDILTAFPSVSVFVVRGQHDQYFRNNENFATSLGNLIKNNKVTLLSDSPVEISNGKRSVFVYGCDYGQEEIPKVVDTNVTNILVIHRMITDTKLWNAQTDYSEASSFLEKNPQYSIIFCGDAHRNFMVTSRDNKRLIFNTGPLLRLEASEDMYEHHPCFYVYSMEEERVFSVTIPHKSADEVLSRVHIERQKAKQEWLDKFVSSVKENMQVSSTANIDCGMSFKDNLLLYIAANNIDTDVQDILNEVMMEGDRG